MSENAEPSKTDAPLILGVSGLRGIVGQSLTPEVAVRYAAAFGAWLYSRVDDKRPMVVVGRDGRDGGQAVYHAAISGLLAAGCRVRTVDVATTPSVGVVADKIRADGAVIVTASHNPQEWNGLKLLVRSESWGEVSDARESAEDAVAGACAPDASTANEIIDLFRSGEFGWCEQHELSGPLIEDDVEHAHCLRVLLACERVFGLEYFWGLFDESPLTVVTDAVNCSACVLDRVFFPSTPCRMVALHGDGSGVFPHTPEPTRENLSGEGGLCDAVPGLKADVGFAQDPDADRLAIVDETGAYIGEEYTLVLCAMALLEGKAGPSARAEGSLGETPSASLRSAPPPSGTGEDSVPVLVTNLSTSRMIEDVAAHYGARVERTPVGEANVVERMLALKAAGERVVLGGEGNGGVIWPEVVYVRDSLSGMALVLSLMARTGKTVSELVRTIDQMSAGGKGYTIVKRKVDIPSKAAADPAVRAVDKWAKGVAGARTDRQDGARVDFDEGEWAGSWVHVRASNTEPIMRLICEAPSEGVAGEVLSATEGAIAG